MKGRLIFHVLFVLAHTTLYAQVHCECNVKINSEILQLPYPQYENVTYMYEVVHDVQTDRYLNITFNVSVDIAKPASAWLWGPRPPQCDCPDYDPVEVINESHYEFKHKHRLSPANRYRQSMSLYSTYLDVKSNGRTLCALQIIVGSQSQKPVLKMEWRELPSVYLLQIVTVSTGFPGGFKAQHLECGVDNRVVPLIHNMGTEMLFNGSVLKDFKDKTCSVRFVNYLQQEHRERIDLPVVVDSYEDHATGCSVNYPVILGPTIPFAVLTILMVVIIITMRNRLIKVNKELQPRGHTNFTIINKVGHHQSKDSSMTDVECHAPSENTSFLEAGSQLHIQNDGTSENSLSSPHYQRDKSESSIIDSCSEITCSEDYLCSTFHPDTSISVPQSY